MVARISKLFVALFIIFEST